MPSNIEAKLYLGDILICSSVSNNPLTQCKGPYAPYVGSCVSNFDSITYQQYFNNSFGVSIPFTTSYKQLYIYNGSVS
jgi:hypothetical protein